MSGAIVRLLFVEFRKKHRCIVQRATALIALMSLRPRARKSTIRLGIGASRSSESAAGSSGLWRPQTGKQPKPQWRMNSTSATNNASGLWCRNYREKSELPLCRHSI